MIQNVAPGAIAFVSPERPGRAGVAEQVAGDRGRSAEVGAFFAEHFDFVWRSLRRLGLQPADADDAAQQVFLVVARQFERIEKPRARAYLGGIAFRVAQEHRRNLARHPLPDDAEATAGLACPRNTHEMVASRELLDELLSALPDELRCVFIFAELEEFSVTEIAETLGIPRGTAASRLRRAKEAFERSIGRFRARHGDGGQR